MTARAVFFSARNPAPPPESGRGSEVAGTADPGSGSERDPPLW